MAFMMSRSRRAGKVPVAQAQAGLPVVNYYLPLVITLLTTTLLFLVIAFLTSISFANVARALAPQKGDPLNALLSWPGLSGLSRLLTSGDSNSGSLAGNAFFCGITGIIGLALTLYFLWAIIKVVRDLITPMHYTRGTIADKRTIAGRVAGDWIGVLPSYVGPDIARATQISDEQSAASADRSRIVNTRSTPAPRPQPQTRGAYLSPGRISVQAAPVVTASDLADEKPAHRAVFRIDAGAFSQLHADEEVLVAHSRFLEHIFYVAHLRDGEWESYKNNALI
jgi:hypothetical protein